MHKILRRLYDWTLSLSAKPYAAWWLAFIAFIESSFFLVPADVLYIPMALSRPALAYRYALIATTASVLGGIVGYGIGFFAFETIAKPILSFYGKLQAFDQLRQCGGNGTVMIMLVTSGLSHIPPIKIVTILAGLLEVSFGFFVISCIVARGARFFAIGWGLKHYGAQIQHFIEKRLMMIAVAIIIILILLYLGLHFLKGPFLC